MTLRFALPFCVLVFLLGSRIAHAEEPRWFQKHIVGMEVGPTGAQFGNSDPTDKRYCFQFDGREIVRKAVEANSEYLVLWVRDGDYAYYDSKLLAKAPGLGSRDPLREAIEEAKKWNIPIISYCVVQQGGHYLTEHPEFAMRSADDKSIGRFCFNSGYLDAMKQIVAEQSEYGIDGFHIDMLDQGFGPPYGCWCDHCKTLFQKRFSSPMPTSATWDESWDKMLQFRYETSDRFEKELDAYIKSVHPKATVDFNYHGNPPFSFELGQRPVQHAQNGDFVTGETGVWGFSASTVGLNAAFYKAATPGKPVQVAMQRGVRMYHDQTTRPLVDMRWEMCTLLAHGSFVTMIDKTGLDGSLDPVAYERMGAVLKEARAKRAHFGQNPIATVGLYYSSRSRDWIGRDKPLPWMQSFLGAHKALVVEHVPYGVVLDENATIESMKLFPVMILPNVGIISPEEKARFEQYVESGGKLIVTGHTGQFDRMGRPLVESTLSDLIGAKSLERLESRDNWLRFGSSFAMEGVISPSLRRDWPFLVEGPATIYQPTSAKTIGELLKPHRTTRQLQGKESLEWPMSADAPVGPAILLNSRGKGMVLTFSGSPDLATASEHHIVEARRLLTDSVHFLAPSPRVRISAPANVESVISDDPVGRVLRVHFIAYNATPQTLPVKERPYVLPGLMEDVPLFRATITTSESLTDVSALNRSTEIKRSRNGIELLIEDVHEVIVMKY